MGKDQISTTEVKERAQKQAVAWVAPMKEGV
jgi:hypothetical protein